MAIFTVYCPPKTGKVEEFLSQSEKCVNKATRKYENIVVMGDINIDAGEEKININIHFAQFCDIFELENVISDSTFVTKYMSKYISSTNQKRSFKNIETASTGISDFIRWFLSH